MKQQLSRAVSFGCGLLLWSMLSGCGSDDDTRFSVAPPVIKPTLVEIPLLNVSAELGNFDPAPTVDASADLWMSYSHVSADSSGIKLVETRLATSDDGGSSWGDLGLKLNAAVVFSVSGDTVASTHEVSRLVYNPYAVAAGADPWIMLWHRYLGLLSGSETLRLFEHGWIGMKSGATATTLGNERKLFSGSLYDTANNSDSLGAPEVALDTIDPALAGCVVFSEPGVLAKSNGLYVALFCARLSPPGKIILLRCDHAMNNCSYRGVLIDGSEAAEFDTLYNDFSAAELVSAKGRDYLIVTPSKSDIYRGCVMYRITSLEQAQIERVEGVAEPTAIIEAHGDFNGACGYVEGLTDSGVIISEAFTSALPAFRIFTTGYNFD